MTFKRRARVVRVWKLRDPPWPGTLVCFVLTESVADADLVFDGPHHAAEFDLFVVPSDLFCANCDTCGGRNMTVDVSDFCLRRGIKLDKQRRGDCSACLDVFYLPLFFSF